MHKVARKRRCAHCRRRPLGQANTSGVCFTCGRVRACKVCKAVIGLNPLSNWCWNCEFMYAAFRNIMGEADLPRPPAAELPARLAHFERLALLGEPLFPS
jgi:hypothetical protein